MATTNSWSSSSGTGDFLDGTNWSLNIPPAAGQFDVVGFGEPLLQDASVDGFSVCAGFECPRNSLLCAAFYAIP